MAFKNLIDDTSTTVSASTPGVTLDLTGHTTLSRSSAGVPVRFWVFAASTVASDSGSVAIMDSSAAITIAVNVTGTTAQWYVQDGFLPASAAKYDAWYGGNTLGTLTVYAFSLYELASFAPFTGTLAATIGTFTLAATATAAGPVRPEVYDVFKSTYPSIRGYATLVAMTSTGPLIR